MSQKQTPVTAEEKEDIRRKLAVTAEELRLKAIQLAVIADEKEDIRRKLAVTAEELRLKASQLAVTAKEKESIRNKLAITAKEKESIRQKLVITAKEKESTRRKLAITAKEKESIRRKLVVTAEEKESIRRKLAVTAEELRLKAIQLAVIADEKESIRMKLAVTAEEKESIRNKLAITAKEKESIRNKLAITAKEKEDIRRKLAVTAKEKESTRRKLAITAKEKESIRRKLVVTAEKLRLNAKQQNAIKTELKVSEISYRRLFETAHDGILILDSQTGQITDANPFLEKLLGYSKKEFLNKKLWEVGPPENIKATKVAFKALQKSGQLRYEDLPLQTKSGQPVEVEFISNSYIAGETLVIQCNIRDITERRKLERAKEIARLLEEEKLKVASIADATHELRTPIAIIKGNVDLAMRDNSIDQKSMKSTFSAINYEIKHLAGILSDLSLITAEKGELRNKVTRQKVNLRSLIEVVVRRGSAIAYKKNISIVAKEIPDVTILGDNVYLEKMFVNLVKNSIIYGNKDGHTKIYAKLSHGFVTISVEDDGTGISKEDLPYVFERFYRADKSHSSGRGSIGLGLSIVKWVAETHNGKVSAQSKKKGSIFNVTLPIISNNNK